MANTDNAKGLVPVNSIGGTFSGKLTRYYFDAATGTAAYVGSLVKPSGSGDANGVMGVTSNVSTGDAVLGAIVAVEAVTADSLAYRVAATERYCLVADDPHQIFEVQEDGTSAVTAVGNVADLAAFTSGTAAYGTSITEISTASISASGDGTEDVVMLGLSQRADNEVGLNSKWLVKLNNHFFADASAGA